MDLSSASTGTPPEGRGVSDVVGFVIVITVILASVTVIVGLGSTALEDTMDRSEGRLAEHTMTLFDSRAAMVALGRSDSQSLAFNLESGTVETDPDAGWISLEHIDYTAGNTETLYNESLGALVYSNGDTEVAYQGGGVWRRQADFDARMLSPPEFHYRGSTLTLPVVRLTGTSAAATSPRVTIRRTSDTIRVFPGDTEYAGTTERYDNPIENGRVAIKVHSAFYEGWAEYARQRTTADVTTFESNETVRLVLESIAGSPGGFDVPLEGDALEVSGLSSGHPVTDFTLTLKPDGNFQNAHWSLYSTDDGGDEFEMHIRSPSQCQNGAYDGNIDFSLYYHNDSSDKTREWQNDAITPGPNAAFDVDCDEETLFVDFTNDNTQLTYQDIKMSGSNNKWCFGEHIAERGGEDPATLDQHDRLDPTEAFDKGVDRATMNFTVNHYMSRMGTEYELTVTDGAGNSECLSGGQGQGSSNVDESRSTGHLEFKESEQARFLTYLHVTENRIDISLD
jgi:hypothetical protein